MAAISKTYNDLYLDARRALKHCDIEGADLEARELVSYASGKDREEFYRDLRLYAGDDVEKRLIDLLERRMDGEPTAYLIGEWSFCGLSLDITRNVLIPRTDTEVVAQRAVALAQMTQGECRVLDLCTGSGCIGLTVAQQVEKARVVLADIEEDVIHVARSNVRRNGLTRQAMCTRADALQDPSPMLGSFDIIVSNPPYIPTHDIAGLDHMVRDFEPHLALDGGEDGLDFYRSIIAKWKRALRPNGVLLLEVGYNQADSVEQLMMQNGYHDIDTRMDDQGIWRCVEGRF